MLGFKDFHTAQRTLESIEVMRMIKKGQMKTSGEAIALRQICLTLSPRSTGFSLKPFRFEKAFATEPVNHLLADTYRRCEREENSGRNQDVSLSGMTHSRMTPVLSDCSQNHYAGAMKDLANGLFGFSRLILIPFVLFQIYAHETASIFSLYTFFVIVVCELVFTAAAQLGNFIQAALVSAPLIALLSKRGKMTWAQNYGNTVAVIFGVSLCISAWFFAEYSVNFLYAT